MKMEDETKKNEMPVPYQGLSLKQYIEEVGGVPPEALIKNPDKTMEEVLTEEECITLYFEDVLGQVDKLRGHMAVSEYENRDKKKGELFIETFGLRLSIDRRLGYLRNLAEGLNEHGKLPEKYKTMFGLENITKGESKCQS